MSSSPGAETATFPHIRQLYAENADVHVACPRRVATSQECGGGDRDGVKAWLVGGRLLSSYSDGCRSFACRLEVEQDGVVERRQNVSESVSAVVGACHGRLSLAVAAWLERTMHAGITGECIIFSGGIGIPREAARRAKSVIIAYDRWQQAP